MQSSLAPGLLAGHRLPGLIRIEASDLPGQSGRLCSQVFFVDDTTMIYDQSLDTRNAVLGRSCNHREAADHFTLHHVIHDATLRIRALRFQDVKKIAVIRDGLLALPL